MFRFKATFSLSSLKKSLDETDERAVYGAYRSNREDEFYGNGNKSESAQNIVPSIKISMPQSSPQQRIKDTKSPSKVVSSGENLPPHFAEIPISSDPRGGTSTNRDSKEFGLKAKQKKEAKNNEQELKKKKEKQQLAEQKKREKIAAQQQARMDKEKKEKERKQAQDAKRKEKQKKKKPEPKPQRVNNPLAQNINEPMQSSNTQVQNASPNVHNITPIAQAPVTYSSNTLDSAISRSSGPPPYSEQAITIQQQKPINSGHDELTPRRITGNVKFGKTMDESTSSWDMISQHRQHLSRPKSAEVRNPTQLTLQYNVGSSFILDEVNKDKNEA